MVDIAAEPKSPCWTRKHNEAASDAFRRGRGRRIDSHVHVYVKQKEAVLRTTVEGNKVTINNTLVIEEGDGEYTINGDGLQFVMGTTFAARSLEAKLEEEVPGLRYDPYCYSNGRNFLTVEASAGRAANKIEINFDSYGDYACDYEEVYAVCKKLILAHKGRHACYRLAGGVVRGAKAGLYKGLPLDVVFSAMVNGKIPVDERDLGDERYITS